MKSLKNAQKAKRLAEEVLLMGGEADPEQAYFQTLEQERKNVMDAFEIGLSYYQMVAPRLAELKNSGFRHYMITWRPPDNINFKTFKYDVEKFIKEWENKWEWWEYAYEQKGTDEATIGTGYHCHLIVATNTSNYYPSHILRDSIRTFPYIAKNCIQVDTLKNLKRAKEYIRGIKEDVAKEPSVTWDKIWRDKIGLQNIYSGGAGQVQPAPQIDINIQ